MKAEELEEYLKRLESKIDKYNKVLAALDATLKDEEEKGKKDKDWLSSIFE